MRSVRDIFKSYGYLDDLGRHVGGSDKETNHRYGDAYERILSVPEMYEVPNCPLPGCRPRSIREDVKLMMEVGIAEGSSLLAWREVFPNALCVGFDIHPAHYITTNADKFEFHLGDMRIKADLERAVQGRYFDFICEDATHRLEDTLCTLFHLWPHVRSGGLYVVEEWHGIGACADNIRASFPFAEIVDTVGPSGGVEPLVVLRKP